MSNSKAAFYAATTKSALLSLFHDHIEEKTAVGRDGRKPRHFAVHLEDEVRTLNRLVRTNKFIFSPYRMMLKSKGSAKHPRELAVPIVRDRVLLKAMANSIYAAEPACKIERPQPKIARIIEALQSDAYTYFVRLDIQNFYPSISHSWMRKVLIGHLNSTELLQLAMQAISTETIADGATPRRRPNLVGVPQGLAISNGLAEMALLHLDTGMGDKAGVAYFRYVDDIIVFTKRQQHQKVFKDVSALMRQAGVRAHPLNAPGSKSQAGRIRDGFEYLGYKFEWPRVSVRNTSVAKLEAALARSFTRYRYALEGIRRTSKDEWPARCREKLTWHLNLIVSGCVFEGTRRGWLSYFSQIRHTQLLRHLDHLVQRLTYRFSIDGLVTFKTFVSSYRHAAKRREDASGFVPNFDLMTRDEQIGILDRIFFQPVKELNRLSDDEVAERFRQRIQRVVQELERDIGAFS